MKLEHSAINVKDAKAVAQWWSEHLGNAHRHGERRTAFHAFSG